MLNALRHLRFGQDTASPVPSIKRERAQRLAASKVWAAKKIMRLPQRIIVLNALRHLRFGQTNVICFQTRSFSVLNALRHLRFGQIKLLTSWLNNMICAQRLAASKVWAD